MTGKESGHHLDADALEVVPGAQRQQLEGWVPELANENELREALEHAFDYRGDVLITKKDGGKVEGYVFDRRTGSTLKDSHVRLVPKDGGAKMSVSYADIAALAFTGRDMAAGTSWENWVKRYTDRGYRVIARSWPGMEGDIEELRRDPSGVAGLGLGEIVDGLRLIWEVLEPQEMRGRVEFL